MSRNQLVWDLDPEAWDLDDSAWGQKPRHTGAIRRLNPPKVKPFESTPQKVTQTKMLIVKALDDALIEEIFR